MKNIIVHNEKKKIEQSYQQRSLIQKIFGNMILKVAMVGDGANDLMAIK